MATKLGKVIADFTTSLSTALIVGGTSVSLQSATDDDGIALPAGQYFFTIDGGNSSKEHIVCTLSSTSLTAIYSVSRQGVQASGVVRAHRIGATVSLTDFAHIKYINDLLDGTTNLNASTPLGYDGAPSITTGNQLATKTYVDGVAIAGAPDSSTTTKGITKMSVAPASATAPIAVGDNDPRVPTTAQVSYIPTSGQKDGLAATTTPATTNLYTTQKDFQKGAEIYAADAQASDTYVITLSPVPAAYVTGMVVRFKANTLNTGAATLNVNSLGAIAIKKAYNSALETGDILANQLVTVMYDGTNFQMQSPVSQSFPFGLYKNGSTTKSASDASTTQNIAHGLGVIPRSARVVCNGIFNSGTAMIQSYSVYNGTTQSSMSTYGTGAVSTTCDSSFTLNLAATNGTQVGVITFDATNIIITWTKTNSPSGTYQIVWDAQA